MDEPTAGLVIIGNEILSGKIADQNTPFLTRRLFELGVEVKEICVIPDRVDLIADRIAYMSRSFKLVFTSGGIGPTHDDMTIEAVAQATQCGVVVHPELRRLLVEYFKTEDLTPAQLRLAQVPDKAELLYPNGAVYPQVRVNNIYIFPGIPDLLRKKFELVAHLFQNSPWYRRKIELQAGETDIAHILDDIDSRFPDVRLGSYPIRRADVWWVELVLESRDRQRLEDALQELYRLLPD